MTAPDWKPLWNAYGDRRHIATDPPQTKPWGHRGIAWRAMCGGYFWPRDTLTAKMVPADRMDSATLCKVCAKVEGVDDTLLTRDDYSVIYDAVNEYLTHPNTIEREREDVERILRKVENYL